jgi:hypothetical protein
MPMRAVIMTARFYLKVLLIPWIKKMARTGDSRKYLSVSELTRILRKATNVPNPYLGLWIVWAEEIFGSDCGAVLLIPDGDDGATTIPIAYCVNVKE